MKVSVRRTGTMMLLAALATASAPAIAHGKWRIPGRGFGHGAGVSQYGALGFAEHGRGYKQILGHYYVRTKVGKTDGERVRVLLDAGDGSVGFSGAAKACGESLDRDRQYRFEADGGGVELREEGGQRITGCGKEGQALDRGTVRIGGLGRYRGSLVARNSGGGLLVINALGVEGYVKGVVANEVPSSWPVHALRTQAVVARSYGIATERSGPFDHYADTRSQVYGGKESETEATNAAVSATRHEVVKYKGEVATTYYFSTSGGQTENVEFAFSGGSPVPYLKSVKDPYDDSSPVHRWKVTYSDAEMESRLSGLFSGNLREIDVLERGRSPRIVRARVVGSKSSTTVTGDTLRARLGLRSTWARFKHG